MVTKKTWQDIEQRALHDPVLHQAVTRVRYGEWTREEALTFAAVGLSEMVEAQRKQLIDATVEKSHRPPRLDPPRIR